jgi:hypothetical protein
MELAVRKKEKREQAAVLDAQLSTRISIGHDRESQGKRWQLSSLF